MTRLMLKYRFRSLIGLCGGLDEAVAACRAAAETGEGRSYSRAQLARCMEPHAPDFAPVDVVLMLEAYCGEPVVSRAMAEARPAQAAGGCLREQSSEATEVVADLQGLVRRALADDQVSEAEARDILAGVEAGSEALRDVALALAQRIGRRSR